MGDVGGNHPTMWPDFMTQTISNNIGDSMTYIQPNKPIEAQEDELGVGEWPDNPSRPIPFRKIMAETERCLIEQAMANMRGNQVRAAAQLGISRSTLIKRLRQYAKEARAVSSK